MVYQNDTPPAQMLDFFGGLGVIGDQLGVIAYDPFGTTRFIDVNLTSGLGVDFPLSYSNLSSLDIVFSASPIIEQPESLLVDVGQQATLNTASFDPNASYQWRRAGMNLVDDARISGTTTDTLTINDAQLTDTNAYTCVVIDSTGASEESVAAILAVRGDAAQTCTADLNGDGELNFFDVSVFLSAYSAGCP